VERLAPLTSPERTFVVTGGAHAAAVARQLPGLPEENVLVEPSPRDSCAAIGLAAAIIAEREPQAVMGSFAADHLVSDPARFAEVVRHAVTGARAGYLMTLGITPTHPETGYGYLECGSEVDGGPVRKVTEFKEKPSYEVASAYVESGQYLWNAGMFVWQVGVVLDAYREHLPATARAIQALEDAHGTERYEAVLGEVWEETDRTTIDYGIAEKAKNVAVVPADIGWHDVGSWQRLAEIVGGHNTWAADEHVSIDSAGVYGWTPGKLLALVGVSDLIVVDTGDVLLVASRERSEDVKAVVDRLRQEGREDLL